jgi:hypothetical protein
MLYQVLIEGMTPSHTFIKLGAKGFCLWCLIRRWDGCVKRFNSSLCTTRFPKGAVYGAPFA